MATVGDPGEAPAGAAIPRRTSTRCRHMPTIAARADERRAQTAARHDRGEASFGSMSTIGDRHPLGRSLIPLTGQSEIFLYPNRMGLESSSPTVAVPPPGLARQVELALVEVDLSLPQYRILILLDEGKVAASALADRLAVSRPSVTAVVDGLVTRGLVERHHDPADRRRVGHDLTAEGRRLLEER